MKMKHCEECGAEAPRYAVSMETNFGLFTQTKHIENVCKECLGNIVSIYVTEKRGVVVKCDSPQ